MMMMTMMMTLAFIIICIIVILREHKIENSELGVHEKRSWWLHIVLDISVLWA